MELSGAGSLSDCCERYDIRCDANVHHALGDARAAAMLLAKLLNDSTQHKAKKARTYGIRIMHEAVFWNAIGVKAD